MPPLTDPSAPAAVQTSERSDEAQARQPRPRR